MSASLFSFNASAEGEPSVSAKGAILIDSLTGEVLYEKNADQQALIASTTKIMTALLVCEQCNVLDRMRIPKEAVGIEGSSMYLREGEVLTVQELLYGLMLRSGNDAAVALAIYCGGTVEGFAEMMNDIENGIISNYMPSDLNGNQIRLPSVEKAQWVDNSYFKDSTGAYTGEPRQVLMCACSKNQISAIRKIAFRMDSHAIVTVGSYDEAFGEGFQDPHK